MPSFYGDVYETIVDGVSGLSAGGDPSCQIVGSCSLGEVGKKYLLGKNSDLSVLGEGNLVDGIRDFFLTAPADSVIVAVPTTGDIAGSLSTVTKTGTGTATNALTGTPKCNAEVILEITKAGALNEARAKYSTDGGDTYTEEFIIPVGGAVTIDPCGAVITFTEGGTPAESFVLGDTYSFTATAPKSSLAKVIEGVNAGLDLYSPEFVFVAEDMDDTGWAGLGSLADTYYSAHKPVFFITKLALPSGDVDTYVSDLMTKRATFAHRFVVVCAQYGEIIGADGKLPARNGAGILSGTIASANVNQSVGEVNAFPVTVFKMPSGWTEAHSKTLDDGGFTVLRRYAGLKSLFWANGRTMAESISDYQFIEVVRTVFKAIRISRVAALGSLQGAGDSIGIERLKANINTALNTMVKAVPRELTGFQVLFPDNQDIVNNGAAFELELYGVPILRKIKLFLKYMYKEA
ncbi:MAG TPA: hypothetical protein DHW82_09735 [Spirochaetia bacterium]|nr:hypothetical protein [Spirochaetia bacterium]